jgi:L-amino acid N-acyltransferase YncA
MVTIREYTKEDCSAAMEIWNAVVREGIAFPQDEELTEGNANEFFLSQSYTGIAEETQTGQVVGMYILHPNNVGRCGHICNTSYAVSEGMRGMHIGEQLVKDSLKVAFRLGFRILQFNAVVATNTHALHLYQRLGFSQLGTIPHGFRMKDGHYEDIIPHYIELIG